MTQQVQEIQCQPDQYPGCCHQRKLTDGQGQDQYYPYLGSMILNMEDANDEEGLEQVWQGYGYRDAIKALNLLARHPEFRLNEAAIDAYHAEQERRYAERAGQE